VNDFTTFSLVFNPSGAMTRQPNRGDVFFSAGGEVPLLGTGYDDALWDDAVANADTDNDYSAGDPKKIKNAGEPGAEAITMFDYAKFIRQQGEARKDYLDENAQLMPINALLGMLLERR